MRVAVKARLRDLEFCLFDKCVKQMLKGAVLRDLVLFQKPKNVFGLTETVK